MPSMLPPAARQRLRIAADESSGLKTWAPRMIVENAGYRENIIPYRGTGF
jgi:hypothetical protein